MEAKLPLHSVANGRAGQSSSIGGTELGGAGGVDDCCTQTSNHTHTL